MRSYTESPPSVRTPWFIHNRLNNVLEGSFTLPKFAARLPKVAKASMVRDHLG
jgi:hypothetical protein